MKFQKSVVGYGSEDSGKSIIKEMILKIIEYKMVIMQTDRMTDIIWNRAGGAVGQSVRPARRRFGVPIPAATDVSRKNI